jgi:hypothetical protein
MKGMKAIGVALLAGILAGGAQAVACQSTGAPSMGGVETAGATGAHQLTAQLPAAIWKGQNATLILHVRKDGQPVDQVAACLATAPLFVSLEDAIDTTPAGGVDLGTGAEFTARPACTNAIAGVRSGPGTYVFTWEPDTAGRVNLTFTAGAGTLTVPVDVASAPPSAAILILFVAFVAAVLTTAAGLRRLLQPGGAAS